MYKIRLSSGGFTQDFKKLFPECDVELFHDELEKNIDLLIFVGGADVNPKRYGDMNRYSKFNDERDEFEFDLFRKFRMEAIDVNYVMGICRGTQFLNVALGGSLYQDLEHENGTPHSPIHGIQWQRTVPIFDEITDINSFHHQAIRFYGDRRPCRVLGIEPGSGIIESIAWGNQIIGFQFHPEWMHQSHKSHQLFRKGVYEWLAGNLDVYRGTLRKSNKEEDAKPEALKEFGKENRDWAEKLHGVRFRVNADNVNVDANDVIFRWRDPDEVDELD